ncbi:hypothetical protein BC828DRAFT_372901 [Blastocladiella britannica]|nr:hypothetical protein BC828DRAFT_372901 [Blastocladiella britannica]
MASSSSPSSALSELVCSLTSLAHLAALVQFPAVEIQGRGSSLGQAVASTATDSPTPAQQQQHPNSARIEFTIPSAAHLAQLPPALIQCAVHDSISTDPTSAQQRIMLPLQISISLPQLASIYQSTIAADAERLTVAVRGAHAAARTVAVPPYTHASLKLARAELLASVPTIEAAARALAVSTASLAALVGTTHHHSQESLMVRVAYVVAGTLDVVKAAKRSVAGHVMVDAAHRVMDQMRGATAKVAAKLKEQRSSGSFSESTGPTAPGMAGLAANAAVVAPSDSGLVSPRPSAAAQLRNKAPKLLNLVRQMQLQAQQSLEGAVGAGSGAAETQSQQQQRQQHVPSSPALTRPTTLSLDDSTSRFIRSMHLLLDMAQSAATHYATRVSTKATAAGGTPWGISVPSPRTLRDLRGGSDMVSALGAELGSSASSSGTLGGDLVGASPSSSATATAGAVARGWISRAVDMAKRGDLSGSGSSSSYSNNNKPLVTNLSAMFPVTDANGRISTLPPGTEPGSIGIESTAPPMPTASFMASEQYAALSIPRNPGNNDPNSLAERLYPTISAHNFNPDHVPAFPVPLSSRLGTFALVSMEQDERLRKPMQSKSVVAKVADKLRHKGQGDVLCPGKWTKSWIELDLSLLARHELVIVPLIRIQIHGEDGEVKDHYMADTLAQAHPFSLVHAVVEHAKEVTKFHDVIRVRLVSGVNLLLHVGSQRRDTWMGHLRCETRRAGTGGKSAPTSPMRQAHVLSTH